MADDSGILTTGTPRTFKLPTKPGEPGTLRLRFDGEFEAKLASGEQLASLRVCTAGGSVITIPLRGSVEVTLLGGTDVGGITINVDLLGDAPSGTAGVH